MAVADQQIHARLLCRVDHRRAFVERQRHRFLDQHMPAGPGRRNRMVGVKLVRGCDIDRIERVVGAHVGNRSVCRAPEIGFEPRQRLRAGVGRGSELQLRMPCQGRQHHAEPASQPGNAKSQSSVGHKPVPEKFTWATIGPLDRPYQCS